MSALPQNVHDLLTRLNETSRHELDLVRDLSEAIRRADDQLLKEVLPHREPHREQIAAVDPTPPTINGHASPAPHEEPTGEPALEEAVIMVEPPMAGRAGDWRQAAQRIDAELAQYFGGPGPRH